MKINSLFVFLSLFLLTVLSGCTKSELSLKASCSTYIPGEKQRFENEGDMANSRLWGVFYSTDLNTCVSKWDLWAGDIGTLEFGYFDVEKDKELKEIIEYANSSDGSTQFPSWPLTLDAASKYESDVGLLTDSVGGSQSSESHLGQSVCNLDPDQAKLNRVDEIKNEYYYDTYQDIFYSKTLNTCLSKWQRYWVNDETLQILYYDALSGQIINDENLPYFSIPEFTGVSDEQLQDLLQLQSVK